MPMDEEKVQRLHAWFTSNGGTLQNGVYIDHDAETGYCLRARSNYTYSEPVLHLPRDLTFSLLSTKHATSIWPKQFMQQFEDEPYILTRFMLIDEYLHGSGSFWWPYIDMLPEPAEESPSFNTPLWFDEQDMEWLQGTNLAAAVREREVAWKKEFHHGLQILRHSGYAREMTWSACNIPSGG